MDVIAIQDFNLRMKDFLRYKYMENRLKAIKLKKELGIEIDEDDIKFLKEV